MKEPNQNEVNIRASITGSSLSVGAKSRAISAIDRLVGGLLGIPAAWFERIESRIRSRSFLEEKMALPQFKWVRFSDIQTVSIGTGH